MKKQFAQIALIFTLLAATACAGFPTPPPAGSSGASPTATSSTQATLVPTSAPQAAEITNRPWKWLRTEMSDGAVLTPNRPDAFTLTLNTDGSLAGTTDCNSFFGSYSRQDNLLSFGPFGATKMFCEGSQETEFLKYLAEVQSYLVVDNQLVLELRYGSGQILFE